MHFILEQIIFEDGPSDCQIVSLQTEWNPIIQLRILYLRKNLHPVDCGGPKRRHILQRCSPALNAWVAEWKMAL